MVRPLTGEPLPLDLLNTQWAGPQGPQDALADDAGALAWLAERGLEPGAEPERVLAHLRSARDAIRRALEAPGEPASFDALNALLARGHVRDRLTPGEVQSVLEVAPEERIAWLAAHELAELQRTRPDRIRHCGGDGCVLWFLDTTRNGTRRWCSMEGCGNRMKVRRHRAQRG